MSFPQEIRAEGAVLWPKEIDAVYVILHPIKEKDRHDRLIPHLIQRGIPREKIKIVAAYWGDELTSDIIFKVYDPFLKRPCATFTFKGRSLTRGEISLGLNFYFAMRTAIDDGTQRVITLESDVFLREDFVGRLRDLLTDLKGREWDYVSLGEGVGTRPAAATRRAVAEAPGSARVIQTLGAAAGLILEASMRACAGESIRKEDEGATIGLDPAAQLQAQGRCGDGASRSRDTPLAPEPVDAVGGQGLDRQDKVIVLEEGVSADRRAATALQGGHGAPLGRDGQGRRSVTQGRQPGKVAIRLPGLDGQGALARSRWGVPGIDEAAGQVRKAQPVQARGRQQDSVGLAGPELLQPGIDIAAQHAHVEVGPQVQALGLAAERGRAQAGALGQVFQTFGDQADEGVPRVLSLGDSRQDQALGRGDGHVLERVDGAVNLAVEQGLLDLLGEEPLATDF